MLRNDFVTEISEKDFKKLNLVGYDNERVDNPDGTHQFKFIKKDLNKKLEEYKYYLADLIREGQKLPWVITLCTHIEPTEDSITYYQNNYKNFEGNTPTREEALQEALFDFSYLDKWMDRSGHTTYEFGVGIDHLYSTRDKWVAHWIDYFEVKKRETKACYIIHLDGNPEEYVKNGTD